MALATVAEVAEWLGQPAPSGQEETRMILCLESASQKVESICGRRFESITETRTFDTSTLDSELLVDDFQNVTAVEERQYRQDDYVPIDSGDYESFRTRSDRPFGILRRIDHRYWAVGDGAVRVTAQWGWGQDNQGNSIIPDSVKLAAIMESAARYQSNKNPGGDGTGFEGDVVPSVLAYDPRVLQLLDPFKSSGKMFG